MHRLAILMTMFVLLALPSTVAGQDFVDPDQRGDETLGDAEEILVELRSLGEPNQGIESLGDPFMLQRYYPGKTMLDISTEKSSTILFPVPIDLMAAFRRALPATDGEGDADAKASDGSG